MSFSMSHTVTLAHPISIVFEALSDVHQLERLERLSPEAKHFSLLPSDFVQLPPGGLTPLFTPDLPPNADNLPRPMTMDKYETPEVVKTGDRVVERVRFKFSGTVPLLSGLINPPVQAEGAQIVDTKALIVLFESVVKASGIRQVKVRTFEEVELGDGKKGTKVKETVWGTCPWLLSRLLRFIAPGPHRYHMDRYHTLFDGKNSW